MLKCSYCESTCHNITTCKEDQDIVDFITNSKTMPEYSLLKDKLLRRVCAQYKMKTTLPRIQIILQLTRKWQEKRKQSVVYDSTTNNSCSICYETIEKTNCCTTSCGHSYCLSCMLEHVQSRRGDSIMCPMCRNVLKEGKIITNNTIHNDNIIQYIGTDNVTYGQSDGNLRIDLQTINDGNNNGQLQRSFIYNGNDIHSQLQQQERENLVQDNQVQEEMMRQIESDYIDYFILNRGNRAVEQRRDFIEEIALVDELFTEPEIGVEVIRETYRNV